MICTEGAAPEAAGWQAPWALVLALLAGGGAGWVLFDLWPTNGAPLRTGPTSPASADITGPARVTDGDTLDVGDVTLRLYGIDASEGRQTCGREGVTWLWRGSGQGIARAGARPDDHLY